ncbi:hypothetical protein A3466_09175 [Enterobacter genomosp. S]|uniref:Uncharacterized protein n=2 Tax=Enterobacter genomosp. S TaxID=2364151 RepID=A0ABR5YPK6_9ENTR|nr:hypothetical protein A3466_09175 [Enterobacter genomosp. S]
MLVRHEGRTWKAGVTRRGKLILSSAHCNKLVKDDEVQILLDGRGNPLGDYSPLLFEVVYHARDYEMTDVVSNFVKVQTRH